MFRKIVSVLVIASMFGCEVSGPDNTFEDQAFVKNSKFTSEEPEQVEDHQYATQQSPLKLLQLAGYTLTTGWAKKHVAGCINQVANRLAVRLNKDSSQVFDMHAAVYPKNGKLCFGLYESMSQFTRCTCSPTKDQVEQFFYEAALAVGVAASVAWAAAKVAAPLMLPLLVL